MIRVAIILTSLLGILMLAQPAVAHCDTTRGPVVNAAREALEANDANLVLHWVRPEDEAVVRRAFEHTIKVRALGAEAKELADHYFFETVVRIHRAGECAPYTGLTDGEPEPIIAATDRALEQGTAQGLEQQLMSAVKAGLAERFARADHPVRHERQRQHALVAKDLPRLLSVLLGAVSMTASVVLTGVLALKPWGDARSAT